jgi:nicotinate-nucleotide adenylyltransferase
MGLPKVRMILSARPGHRQDPNVAPEHRWEMLKLACAEHRELVADDIELKRPGESYTVRTLEEIHRDHPGAIACWILGQDSFATLTCWFEWERILELANLVVLERPGQLVGEPQELKALCQSSETDELQPSRHGQIVRLRMQMLTVSSTEIRNSLAQGGRVDDLLASPVYNYIRRHQLYQNPERAI